MNRIDYQDCWVAYVDILGYRRLVQDAVTQGAEFAAIQRLRELVGIATYCVGTSMYLDEQYPGIRFISDALCVAVPVDKSSCCRFVTDINFMVSAFALRGLFVRGAIARGGHFDDGVVLFSPALVEAYELEQTCAEFPRILLSDTVACTFWDQWANRHDPIDRFLTAEEVWQDADGRSFLNHLARYFVRECGEKGGGAKMLLQHRANVDEQLLAFSHDDKIFLKYVWLAGLHNSFCRRVLAPEVVSSYLVGTCSEPLLEYETAHPHPAQGLRPSTEEIVEWAKGTSVEGCRKRNAPTTAEMQEAAKNPYFRYLTRSVLQGRADCDDAPT